MHIISSYLIFIIIFFLLLISSLFYFCIYVTAIANVCGTNYVPLLPSYNTNNNKQQNRAISYFIYIQKTKYSLDRIVNTKRKNNHKIHMFLKIQQTKKAANRRRQLKTNKITKKKEKQRVYL